MRATVAAPTLCFVMQASVAGYEEDALSNLLGEDPGVAEQRKQLKAQADMLRKAVHEISAFNG